jgi:hypothetical protein
MKLFCKTHKVTLIIEGDTVEITREIDPKSSLSACILLVMDNPQPGKFGECEVVQG